MLSIALPYKVIFKRASRVNRQYTCFPCEKEWQYVADVVERLRLFNDITELFSGTEYVTANITSPKFVRLEQKSVNGRLVAIH